MQIDWWTLALQTVNFLVVVWLLTRFLYRPVRRIIEEREAADRKAAEDAASKAEAAETARRDYEAKRAALEEEARKRDAAFHAKMEEERADSRAQAKREAESLLAEARERIERDRDETLTQLRSQIADLATALARKALEDRPASPEEAIARAAARIDDLPEAEKAELSRDLDGEGSRLAVVSVGSLPDAAQEGWRAALAERFGPDIRVEFESDPDILAGHRLHFPHAVLDFSVGGRLDRAAAQMEA
jgi:F-type H+-transporting ATPase subunit b